MSSGSSCFFHLLPRVDRTGVLAGKVGSNLRTMRVVAYWVNVSESSGTSSPGCPR